ncbi:MAG: class I ribonucleotide reductase maintenance protein YfaE [Psychromonas sp.]
MSAILTVDGIEYPLDTKKTLLENLEAQAIKVDFNCRDGHCGVCRCLLVKGEAEYINYPMAYLRDGEILLCCSSAKNNIEIAIY